MEAKRIVSRSSYKKIRFPESIRDRVYSSWHRSTGRFLGSEGEELLSLIDVDAVLYVEIEWKTKEPLVLLEVAEDEGQWKAGTVIHRLAVKAGLPAYCVLYKLASEKNPEYPDVPDIESFRLRELAPHLSGFFDMLSPSEYAKFILRVREAQRLKSLAV